MKAPKVREKEICIKTTVAVLKAKSISNGNFKFKQKRVQIPRCFKPNDSE